MSDRDDLAELLGILFYDIADNDIREWPEEEAEAYREFGFAEGNAAARALVQRKAADAILAAGWRPPATTDNPTEPEAGFDAYYVEWMAKAQDEDDQYTADHPTEASAHDAQCESEYLVGKAEYVVGAAVYTACGCSDRAVPVRVEPTTDNWKDPEPYVGHGPMGRGRFNTAGGTVWQRAHLPRTRAEYDADTAEEQNR